MQNKPAPKSIDEYIAGFPPKTQKILKELRALIKKAAPGVTEKISYAIPTFDLNGRYLLYFAGWKDHLSLYPVTAAMEKALEHELKVYRSGKGTLQLSLVGPLPRDLIRRIVEVRLTELRDSPTRGGQSGASSSGDKPAGSTVKAASKGGKATSKKVKAASKPGKTASKAGKTASKPGKTASKPGKTASKAGKAGKGVKRRAGSVSQKGRER
jgi:uncharacterized protein YdhG (YjbR/CyaY superfamily)